LRVLARGGRTAAILISGRDRVTRCDLYVKLVADELNAAGIPDDAIQVFLATGTHQKQTAEDARFLLGAETYERLRLTHHDPMLEQNLVQLGVTARGTPIVINRGVYESDIKILTGRIAHHYFAGFSGGRKAIAPGVAGIRTILANHRRVMRAQGGGRDPEARAGLLAGNPVHEDLVEIALAARPSFCVNSVLNTNDEITHVFCGNPIAAHLAGCPTVAGLFGVIPRRAAKVVVASCGGWPYDISFMQVIKTIVSAESAVVDGGVLVVFGSCERGLEPGFLEWFQHRSLGDLNRAVLANYNLKGHNSYWLKEIQSRIQIVLVSGLPEGEATAMGFTPAKPETAVEIARYLSGGAPPTIVLTHGNIMASETSNGSLPPSATRTPG
jgi:nickel-dependent lactate racemase